MNKNLNWYLVKADRIAAWTLLATMFTYFVSGYGMTRGIINAKLAVQIHNNILPLIVLTAFTVHTFYAIRLAFKRWKIWDSFGKPLLIVFYIVFIAGFLYIDFLYKKPITKTTTQPSGKIQSQPAQIQAQPVIEKTFTRTELARYNGQNGQPAYVAVSGVVYDLSSIFFSGSHFLHLAGQELTDAFNSQHSLQQIQKYPVVGKIQ